MLQAGSSRLRTGEKQVSGSPLGGSRFKYLARTSKGANVCPPGSPRLSPNPPALPSSSGFSCGVHEHWWCLRLTVFHSALPLAALLRWEAALQAYKGCPAGQRYKKGRQR